MFGRTVHHSSKSSFTVVMFSMKFEQNSCHLSHLSAP